MDEADTAPDQECTDTRQVDDVVISLGSTSGNVHHGQSTECVGQHNSPYRYALLVDVAEDTGRLAGLSHVQDSTGTNVDGRIDSGQTGDENEGVDEISAVFHASIYKSNSHGTLESLALATVSQSWCIGWASDAEEQRRPHVDEDDAPKDLTDSLRNGSSRVSRFGSSDSDRLDTSVESRAEDKDGGNTTESIAIECAGVIPVMETQRLVLASNTSSSINDGENEVGGQSKQFEQGQPKLRFAESFNSQELETEKDGPQNEEETP